MPTSLKKVDDSSWRTFLRRLVHFHKPSNKIFARLEVVKGQPYAQIGCYLLEVLADESQVGTRVLKLWNDFLNCGLCFKYDLFSVFAEFQSYHPAGEGGTPWRHCSALG